MFGLKPELQIKTRTPDMIKVGIIGGAGYTAGELLRILLHHQDAEITFIHSKSNANKPVYHVHQDLLGDTDLVFSEQWHTAIDVLFLCVGHGDAAVFLQENKLPKSLKIIDLSQDFRLKRSTHEFVYGLPEMNREAIKKANFVANPGCFATAIQLALLPLAAANEVTNDVHIHAITGSTGAGQKPTDTTHFSWRNNNVSIYEAFQHRHLNEIRESLQQQADFQQDLNFLPLRGNFTRGIFASIYMKTELSEKELKSLFHNYYSDAVFTHISEQNIHLKQVVGTNKALLQVIKKDNKVLIISIIDNLLKGASGQAVQNMNLMFGVKESESLS